MHKTICLIIIAGLLALSPTAIAARWGPPEITAERIYITQEGYVAATSQELLDIALKLALKGNTDEFKYYLSVNPFVFFLKADLFAKIQQRVWPGYIQIYLIDYDLTIWTLKEAIK